MVVNVRTDSLPGFILLLAWERSLPSDPDRFISNTLELNRDFPDLLIGEVLLNGGEECVLSVTYWSVSICWC